MAKPTDSVINRGFGITYASVFSVGGRMSEMHVGVVLTVIGLALVLAGIGLLLVVTESVLALVCLGAIAGLGALVCGSLLLYRAAARKEPEESDE